MGLTDRMEMVYHVSVSFLSWTLTRCAKHRNNRYCVWNGVQIAFVYFMFPETSGRTLEELAFCRCSKSFQVYNAIDGSGRNARTVYEEDRDALRHGAAERLCVDGGVETYGSMEEHPGRDVGGEQR
jgi:hypothetical protein